MSKDESPSRTTFTEPTESQSEIFSPILSITQSLLEETFNGTTLERSTRSTRTSLSEEPLLSPRTFDRESPLRATVTVDASTLLSIRSVLTGHHSRASLPFKPATSTLRSPKESSLSLANRTLMSITSLSRLLSSTLSLDTLFHRAASHLLLGSSTSSEIRRSSLEETPLSLPDTSSSTSLPPPRLSSLLRLTETSSLPIRTST